MAHADTPSSATPAAPRVSVPGGRYEHAVELKFQVERGTTVRYTLDGTTPTRDSRVYSPDNPPQIKKDTNVTALLRHHRVRLPRSGRDPVERRHDQ
ncbi:chitobiase/beta-hexosaminidase C-terminal domain-containing protein [Streptomyces sp. NPDC056086]|uniref:chitobiase/beta-hexosaminidase C-terminal domain-containing protein n=1 Tax=Streptomyces sp. NPDC056086 TaxID=3345709 RepID=UPI0035D7CA4C